MKKLDVRLSLMIVPVILSIYSLACSAGNKKLIEETIKDLDTINKQAIQQIDYLPMHGVVHLKGKVKIAGGRSKVDVQDVQVLRLPDKAGLKARSKNMTEPEPEQFTFSNSHHSIHVKERESNGNNTVKRRQDEQK